MLTRKDFLFKWRGTCCYVNHILIGSHGCYYGKWQTISNYNRTIFGIENRDQQQAWVEQQFVDFLNAILPQDGYRSKWERLKKELTGYGEFGTALDVMREIEASDKADTKNEKV